MSVADLDKFFSLENLLCYFLKHALVILETHTQHPHAPHIRQSSGSATEYIILFLVTITLALITQDQSVLHVLIHVN